ncbi:hypothetical protein EX895_004785 [Sporisorium graminicola]|uniref:Histone-lysine N-methyltransferase SET5 n=1 Tax=Sporisorium graminicola TaxID=280036 RepID=A0A4U7KNM8_9BASI|nr:hypothetical protein EX895_004785 [Sporisorium graminicola]TKY85960.1 hypothetical protein EX895_004785 [Sporisorium graminicola]
MVVPTEKQMVKAAASKLGGPEATLADTELTRLLATLELENDWADVSAKKFRSILVKHNIIAGDTAPTAGSSSNGTATASNGAASSSSAKKKKKSKTDQGVPKSFIDPSVSIPSGIRGEYFDAVKGKGLVATRSFAEGELLFTEEAYIPTPPPEALDQVVRGELCAQCFLPISSAPVALAIKDCHKCKYRFCTSSCHRAAMATHHTLLCTGLNPGASEVMELVREHKWQSLHCVARSLARLVSTLAYGTMKRLGEEAELEQTYGDFETVYGRLSSFATVSELERRSRNPGWSTEKASFEPLLSRAHAALRTALDPYSPSPPSSITPALLDLHTRKSTLKSLFDAPTFLKLLGRANINMEKFGGLYSLHSFLNHSCNPNVQIRHVPARGILASMKIAALALRPIAPHDELVISYIDPNTRLGRRQLLLYRDYCFGPCTCDKCKAELDAIGLVFDPSKHGVKGFLDSVAKKTATDTDADSNAAQPAGADASLEEELRASLGF